MKNAKNKLKKITVYTDPNCDHCENLKKELKDNNIDFTEKPIDKHQGEWYKVSDLLHMSALPTMEVGGQYLVSGRDFQNAEQAVDVIDYRTGKEYKNWPNDVKLSERLKTLNYNLRLQLGAMYEKINNIELKLKKEENEHEKSS